MPFKLRGKVALVTGAGVIHKPYRFHELPLEDWNSSTLFSVKRDS